MCSQLQKINIIKIESNYPWFFRLILSSFWDYKRWLLSHSWSSRIAIYGFVTKEKKLSKQSYTFPPCTSQAVTCPWVNCASDAWRDNFTLSSCTYFTLSGSVVNGHLSLLAFLWNLWGSLSLNLSFFISFFCILYQQFPVKILLKTSSIPWLSEYRRSETLSLEFDMAKKREKLI